MTQFHLARPLAAAITALALAAPSAMALTNQEEQVLASRGVGAPYPAIQIGAPRTDSTDTGFDWSSAGIGAGAAAGLILVAAGGFGATQRTRFRVAR